MLFINNLTVQYDNNEPAIQQFHLSLKRGEIVCLVGESGSGKSTVIRSILGALPQNGRISKGEIEFHNKSLINLSNDEWRKVRGTKIAMIFQDCGGTLNPIRKIKTQFIEYICEHSNLSKDKAYKEALLMLEKMHLPYCDNIMDSYPHQLSGGMKQRIGIAMAMTFNPELLLADEPTSALDVTTQSQIIREMMELREKYNTSMVVITHNIGIAAYMADKIIVLKDGYVLEQGFRDEVVNRPINEYTKQLLAAVPKIGGIKFV